MADWNTVRFMELHYAVERLGAIIYLVNIRLHPQQIKYTLDFAEVDYLLLSSDFKD